MNSYKTALRRATALLLSLLLLSACTGIAVPPPAEPAAGSDCIEQFDPEADLFPEHSNVTEANGFSLTYFNHYKLLDVHSPWPGAEAGEQWLLVQCGTPIPDGFPDATVVEIPIRSVAMLSSTYLPHLTVLDRLDLLVGISNPAHVYAPAVHEAVAAGTVQAMGGGSTVDVERMLVADPDLVMTYGSGSPDYDAHPVLREAGLAVFLNADFLETTPLGRAEWIKATGAFLNAEAAANAHFDAVADRYRDLAAQASARADKPTVFLNTPWEGVWYMAGGQSFLAGQLRDAGADYLWADDDSAFSLWLDFEAVLAKAREADVWLHTGQFGDLTAMAAADARYEGFRAFTEGNVWNNDARLTDMGANDSWESAVVRPDLVLADLVAILHPDLLPDHEFVYYRRLTHPE